MNSSISKHITNYLGFCQFNKRLDSKTVKAYRIDLQQFYAVLITDNIEDITPDTLKKYIANLHHMYKPKTVKRKIASLKAFMSYLDETDIITNNPFSKIHTRFREPIQLPRTIPLSTIEKLLSSLYKYYHSSKTEYSRRSSLQAIAIIELLFATGIRISELCSIHIEDIDLVNSRLLIHGKGKKERIISIVNSYCLDILSEYQCVFMNQIESSSCILYTIYPLISKMCFTLFNQILKMVYTILIPDFISILVFKTRHKMIISSSVVLHIKLNLPTSINIVIIF